MILKQPSNSDLMLYSLMLCLYCWNNLPLHLLQITCFALKGMLLLTNSLSLLLYQHYIMTRTWSFLLFQSS